MIEWPTLSLERKDYPCELLKIHETTAKILESPQRSELSDMVHYANWASQHPGLLAHQLSIICDAFEPRCWVHAIIYASVLALESMDKFNTEGGDK
jgi:hypothetical protein